MRNPSPFFSFLFSLFLSLSFPTLSCGIEKGVTVCVRVRVCEHICVFIKLRCKPPPHPHHQHHLSPSLSRLLYSFFTSNFIFSSVWEEGGYRGADSIRFHDWAAGIQEGHGKVKEFSGTNMIMALYHLIRSKVCHSKVEPLCSCTGTTGPARV